MLSLSTLTLVGLKETPACSKMRGRTGMKAKAVSAEMAWQTASGSQ